MIDREEGYLSREGSYSSLCDRSTSGGQLLVDFGTNPDWTDEEEVAPRRGSASVGLQVDYCHNPGRFMYPELPSSCQHSRRNSIGRRNSMTKSKSNDSLKHEETGKRRKNRTPKALRKAESCREMKPSPPRRREEEEESTMPLKSGLTRSSSRRRKFERRGSSWSVDILELQDNERDGDERKNNARNHPNDKDEQTDGCTDEEGNSSSSSLRTPNRREQLSRRGSSSWSMDILELTGGDGDGNGKNRSSSSAISLAMDLKDNIMSTMKKKHDDGASESDLTTSTSRTKKTKNSYHKRKQHASSPSKQHSSSKQHSPSSRPHSPSKQHSSSRQHSPSSRPHSPAKQHSPSSRPHSPSSRPHSPAKSRSPTRHSPVDDEDQRPSKPRRGNYHRHRSSRRHLLTHEQRSNSTRQLKQQLGSIRSMLDQSSFAANGRQTAPGLHRQSSVTNL